MEQAEFLIKGKLWWPRLQWAWGQAQRTACVVYLCQGPEPI